MNRVFAAFVAALSALAVLVAVPASAQTNSDVYVVHGIPGATVDVYVNGALTLESFEPETVAGPLELPAGDYEIEIFAEDADPSSATAIIDVPAATVPGGANLSLVAHLDASGSPTLGAFVNDVSDTAADEGRITIRHTAAAPAVDIVAGGADVAPFVNLTNGNEAVADLPVGAYPTGIAAAGADNTVLVDAPVAATAGQNLIVYAIGDLAGGSFTLVTQTLDGLLPAATSDVRVVHGVPGLNVDIYVNGALLLEGFAPGTTAGPLQLEAGNYDIDVFAAVADAPGALTDRADDPAIDFTGAIPGNADLDLVAHLDASGVPVITPFVNDTSLIPGGINARVSIRHAAAAPAVDIVAGGDDVAGLTNLANGNAAAVVLPAGNYPTGIAAAGADNTVLAPAPLNLVPGQSVVVYAIGDLAGGSFDLLVRSASGLNLGEQYRDATANAGFTARLYLAALGRNPDAGGFAYWVDRLDNEQMTLERITEFFIDSPEFRERFADIDTDMEYLELAYEHVFGRAPDAGGQDYWMGRLADGSVTRAGLIVFFADSPEFRGYTGTN